MGEISYRPLIEAMTWSYSRLEIFDDCPYRWFLTYIHTPKLKKKKINSMLHTDCLCMICLRNILKVKIPKKKY